MININDNEDYFTLPLIEQDNHLNASNTQQGKYTNKKSLISSINKKRYREIDTLNEENDKETKDNSIKRPKPEIHLEKMFKRITLTDHLPKSRQIKIFSSGKLTSSLLKNVYKNYYPCSISTQYSDQIRNQVIQNQLNTISENTAVYRRTRLENKRKNMLYKEHNGFKEEDISYISVSEKNKDLVEKKSIVYDSEDSLQSNNNYWSSLFRNSNSGIWLNQSEEEDLYSCEDDKEY